MAARPPHSLPAWLAVAEAADVGHGSRVLEVGCGTAGFCEVAAARGAAVSGIDVNPHAIDVARRRVADGDFRVGRMEQLPWEDDRFDLVAGINAIQYAGDVGAALAEARRVARPGAAVAVCKWGPPEHNELFTVLRGVLQAPAQPSREGDDGLERAVRAAGLAPRLTGEVPLALELADADALEDALLRTGGLAGAIERSGEPAVRRAITEAAAPFTCSDGSYRLRNTYRYVIATA